MNCQQVLHWIDSRSSRSRDPGAPPASTLDNARRHVESCERCRLALATAAALDDKLRQLSEPLPPAEMAAVVRARIWQSEPARKAGAKRAQPATSARFRGSAWRWVVAGVGGVIGLGAESFRVLAGDSEVHLWSPVVSADMVQLATLLPTDAGALALVAGVLLVVLGLLAPSSGKRRSALSP